MSQYNQQNGRTMPRGELMTQTYSARSHNSNNSSNSMTSGSSNMSNHEYSPYSQNTSFADNDLSYQNDYGYSQGQGYSQSQDSSYGVVFSQYDDPNHLVFSEPTGPYLYKQWPTQDIPVSPVASFKDECVLTSYEQPSSDHTRHTDNIRHTIRSLGWHRDLRYLQEENRFYKFVPNHGKNPYYELISRENTSPTTPFQVFLAQPITTSQEYYTCAHPFPKTYLKKKCTCLNKFKRPADLERHYRHVHEVQPTEEECPSPTDNASPIASTGNEKAKAKEDEIYRCDRGGCTRASKPLRRKDHFRDHLREFHKEDMGREKWKDGESAQVRAEKQKAWEEARVIIPDRWRCIKCLTNNKVSKVGWVCGGNGCKAVCEPKRRQAREQMIEDMKCDTDVDMMISVPVVCNLCGNIGCQEICEAKEREAKERNAERERNAMALLMNVPGVCNTCVGNDLYSWQNCPDCMRDDGQTMAYDPPFFRSAMGEVYGDDECMT